MLQKDARLREQPVACGSWISSFHGAYALCAHVHLRIIVHCS